MFTVMHVQCLRLYVPPMLVASDGEENETSGISSSLRTLEHLLGVLTTPFLCHKDQQFQDIVESQS